LVWPLGPEGAGPPAVAAAHAAGRIAPANDGDPMRQQTRLVVAAVTVAWATALLAGQARPQGPFGLRQGMSLAEVEKFAGPLSAKPAGFYLAKKVPKPDPALESYGLVIPPKTGLCSVIAIGKTVETDRTGAGLRKAYLDRKARLTKLHGAPARDVDSVRSSSPQAGPQDWMAAIGRQDRLLQTFWTVTGDAGGVADVHLEAVGLNATRGYVRTTYGFENGGACIEELKVLRIPK